MICDKILVSAEKSANSQEENNTPINIPSHSEKRFLTATIRNPKAIAYEEIKWKLSANGS